MQEEADELVGAETPKDISWEAADLIYFALVRWCVLVCYWPTDISYLGGNASKEVHINL